MNDRRADSVPRALRLLTIYRLLTSTPREWQRSALARALGVSERMVDKDIQELREAGYCIARTQTGYRITDEPPTPRATATRRPWTAADIDYVRSHGEESHAEIAQALGRSYLAVARQREKMRSGEFDAERVRGAWTDAECTYLLENQHLTIAQQAAALGRSASAIAGQRRRLGIGTSRRRWNDGEVRYLREHQSDSAEDLAHALGRSTWQIWHKLKNLGRVPGHTRWTATEDAYLREHAGDSVRDVATALNRTENAVAARKIRMSREKPAPSRKPNA